jgi:serine/threonine protein phosphatase 1
MAYAACTSFIHYFSNMSTLVIGDVHGGYAALLQAMERAVVTPKDTLIFLGDLVDGWSQSYQTIQYLMELEKQQPCVFILGNHDEWCRQWLANGQMDATWLMHGGQATFDSYAQATESDRLAHLNFLERMRFYYVDEQNRLFIHAGYSSMHGPEREMYKSNYMWDRTLWEMAVCMDSRVKKHSVRYPKRLLLYAEIFIDHTPTLYLGIGTPMQAINVWNIDTGAAFTGALTIMNVDAKQYWQSDRLQQLYPLEKGRNK